MKRLIKLLIEEEGAKHTSSVYISILLAYLQIPNWVEAKRSIRFLKTIDLQVEEKYAFLYLKDLILEQDQEAIDALLTYLHT